MEAGAIVGALATFAESTEALSGLGLPISVEFKDEVSDFLVSVGDSHEDAGVGRALVIVEGSEATLAEVVELFAVHFFNKLLIINYQASQLDHSARPTVLPSPHFFFSSSSKSDDCDD